MVRPSCIEALLGLLAQPSCSFWHVGAAPRLGWNTDITSKLVEKVLANEKDTNDRKLVEADTMETL